MRERNEKLKLVKWVVVIFVEEVLGVNDNRMRNKRDEALNFLYEISNNQTKINFSILRLPLKNHKFGLIAYMFYKLISLRKLVC